MISYVYFDVGGVLIQDFSGTDRWDTMKRDLGVDLDKTSVFDAIWDTYADTVNTTFDVDGLLPILRKEFGPQSFPIASLLAEFVKRFEYNKSIHPVLHHAQKRYKVGLLTNMYPRMLAAIHERELMPNVLWDSVVDSSVVLMQKPHNDIYALAHSKTGVQKGDVLFIDNKEENINAARLFGWQTFLYDSRNPEKSSKDLLAILSP